MTNHCITKGACKLVIIFWWAVAMMCQSGLVCGGLIPWQALHNVIVDHPLKMFNSRSLYSEYMYSVNSMRFTFLHGDHAIQQRSNPHPYISDKKPVCSVLMTVCRLEPGSSAEDTWSDEVICRALDWAKVSLHTCYSSRRCVCVCVCVWVCGGCVWGVMCLTHWPSVCL